ncbi:MAG TPA: glycine oxidase ThiO [Gammaproteobacteria bacterium]
MINVVVVGGGLSGMLTAYELVSAGCRVELLEQGEIGRESSWAGGGILSPLYPWRYPEAVTRLSRWGQERYSDLCDRLAEATGIDPEWTRSGLLMPRVEEEERDEAILWAAQHDYDLDTLAGEALQRCEPALAEGFGPALWMGSVAQVRNPRLLQALRAALQILGVRLREGCRVDGFVTAAGQVTGVEVSGGEMVGADRVVVTAGAWSARLLAATGIHLPIEPVLGQMILIKGEPGLLRHIVLHEGRYVIPRRDGRLLVGSTLEHTGFNKRTTLEALTDLQTAAIRLVPQLRDLPVERQWAGLRPGSPDGVPFIGEHPEISGLFLNAGHFRNGVVMGWASARLAADLLLGRTPILEEREYALVRS